MHLSTAPPSLCVHASRSSSLPSAVAILTIALGLIIGVPMTMMGCKPCEHTLVHAFKQWPDVLTSRAAASACARYRTMLRSMQLACLLTASLSLQLPSFSMYVCLSVRSHLRGVQEAERKAMSSIWDAIPVLEACIEQHPGGHPLLFFNLANVRPLSVCLCLYSILYVMYVRCMHASTAPLDVRAGGGPRRGHR